MATLPRAEPPQPGRQTGKRPGKLVTVNEFDVVPAQRGGVIAGFVAAPPIPGQEHDAERRLILSVLDVLHLEQDEFAAVQAGLLVNLPPRRVVRILAEFDEAAGVDVLAPTWFDATLP